MQVVPVRRGSWRYMHLIREMAYFIAGATIVGLLAFLIYIEVLVDSLTIH